MANVPRYRIRKKDALNWVIERWREPTLIDRGKHQGKMSKGGWDETNPVGYYNNLLGACARMVDLVAAESCPPEGWESFEEILASVDQQIETFYEKVTD